MMKLTGRKLMTPTIQSNTTGDTMALLLRDQDNPDWWALLSIPLEDLERLVNEVRSANGMRLMIEAPEEPMPTVAPWDVDDQGDDQGVKPTSPATSATAPSSSSASGSATSKPVSTPKKPTDAEKRSHHKR